MKDDEKAFPVVASISVGISLRDWLAGQALSGYIAKHDMTYSLLSSETAKHSYEMADAMLKAREAGND